MIVAIKLQNTSYTQRHSLEIKKNLINLQNYRGIIS